jgi:membrane fusion protein, hemolysin D
VERKLIPFPRRWAERLREDEREFLPAALEIVETPVSAVGRVMMGFLVILVAVAIAWACLGELDIVASANGRIIPSGQIKLIQPLEIGVVKRIMVADGDRVRAGDVLIELDTTTNAADRDKIARDLMQAEVDVARLHATVAGNVDNFAPPPGADPTLAEAGRRQLAAQLAQYRAKIEGLDRQITAKSAERDHATAVIAKINASLPLLQEKVDMYATLRVNQLTSKVLLIEAERQLVEAKHDRIASGHQVEEAEAQIAALIQQRHEADADFHRQALDDLRKESQYAAEQRQDLIKATQRTGLQILRAPVGGTVEQLSVHTIGGVVTPAQTLMVIVPHGTTLEVEAMLPNRDAGFVHAGQSAELKVEAFTYTRYGLLHGKVRSVSRDALRNERDASAPDRDQASGKSSPREGQNSLPGGTAYVARITLAETEVETEQGPRPLEMGMTVMAEIKTGQRRIIEYLLSPFMRYRHEALRER